MRTRLRRCTRQTHKLRPEDAAVVGDNPESELAAGRELGLRTIQILRPGVEASAEADEQARTLGELREWMNA